MIATLLDSKMIGIEKCQMTTSTMINEVNTMTPRQNDLVVKNVSPIHHFFIILMSVCMH